MITFLTIVMFLLALFVNSNWAIVLVVLFILINLAKLYGGIRGRASDPIEMWKCIIVNGVVALILTGWLIWAFLP